MSWIMEQLTMVSGPRRDYVKVREFNCGKTAANTKVTGKMTKPMAKED